MPEPEKHLEQLIGNYPELEPCKSDISEAYYTLVDTYDNGGKLLVCGNGGSAADADHIVGELLKGFQLSRKLPDEYLEKLLLQDPESGDEIYKNLQGSLPAISLSSQSSIITATLNDTSKKYIFAQQIVGYGKPEDCLIAISTSGNSENILTAITVAKAQGMLIIGLTGETGGKMLDNCDILIRVPTQRTARVQEFHLPVYHTLCLMLEARFFK